MITNEMKRNVFLQLRAENYRASLRLEGLVQRPLGIDKPAAKPATTELKIKIKHVR